MYWRILVPLDKSKEAEGVLPLVREHLIPGCQLILLHVIPPGRTMSMGDGVLLGQGVVWHASEQEEAERDRAMYYLRGLASRIDEGSDSCRCEVIVERSVADGIAKYAAREEVDLIVMYTHDRKGLAKLIKGSIAEKVGNKATADVQVIKPQELVAI